MTRRRAFGWVVLAAVTVAVLLVAALGSTPEVSAAERALVLADRFACLQCEGQSVAESQSAFATQVRAEISRRITEGQTDDQISSFLIGTYGEGISLEPRATGIDALVWIVPVVAGVTALAGLVIVFRGWARSAGAGEVSDADRVLVERARRKRGARA